ncbi:MAG: hypothetical protein WEA04_03040 [Candidatus Andersenbacteria bacterium]
MAGARIISLDADDTLLDGIGQAFKMALPHMGCPFDQELFRKTHSWNTATGGRPTEELGLLYAEFLCSDLCPPATVIPGSQEAVETLAPLARIPILTARSEQTRMRTMRELHQYYNGRITEGWFSANGTKHRVVEQHGINLHVDDSLLECQRIVETAAEVFTILYFNPLTHVPPGTPHRRLIILPTSREDVQDMSSVQLESLYRQAWQEATAAALNICELFWPHDDILVM